MLRSLYVDTHIPTGLQQLNDCFRRICEIRKNVQRCGNITYGNLSLLFSVRRAFVQSSALSSNDDQPQERSTNSCKSRLCNNDPCYRSTWRGGTTTVIHKLRSTQDSSTTASAQFRAHHFHAFILFVFLHSDRLPVFRFRHITFATRSYISCIIIQYI